MSTHQSLPKPANAKKKSDILPIPAQSKSHPVIAQPKIESTRSNEEQLAQIRAKREASERLGSTLLIPESVPHTPPPMQPKLTIGQPNDQYEQEADRVARQVVDHINAPPKIQAKTPRYPMSVAARKPSPLDDHPAMKVQRYATGGEMDASPDLESSIQRARGGGQPLGDGIRARMEGAFGADFSRVRVHTDGTSDQLNQSIQAKAFTTGQDVFFRKGAYEPGSRGGQELLAHELTHVVQQKGGEKNGGEIQPKHTVNPPENQNDSSSLLAKSVVFQPSSQREHCLQKEDAVEKGLPRENHSEKMPAPDSEAENLEQLSDRVDQTLQKPKQKVRFNNGEEHTVSIQQQGDSLCLVIQSKIQQLLHVLHNKQGKTKSDPNLQKAIQAAQNIEVLIELSDLFRTGKMSDKYSQYNIPEYQNWVKTGIKAAITQSGGGTTLLTGYTGSSATANFDASAVENRFSLTPLEGKIKTGKKGLTSQKELKGRMEANAIILNINKLLEEEYKTLAELLPKLDPPLADTDGTRPDENQNSDTIIRPYLDPRTDLEYEVDKSSVNEIKVKSVKANKVSLNHDQGTEPEAKDISGYAALEHFKLTNPQGQGWTRLHLLNQQLGGRGIAENLVMGPRITNTQMREWYETVIKKEVLKNGGVIWFEANVEYNSAGKLYQDTDTETEVDNLKTANPPKSLSTDLADFAKKITIKVGVCQWKNGKWENDTTTIASKDITWEPPVFKGENKLKNDQGAIQNNADILTNNGDPFSKNLSETATKNVLAAANYLLFEVPIEKWPSSYKGWNYVLNYATSAVRRLNAIKENKEKDLQTEQARGTSADAVRIATLRSEIRNLKDEIQKNNNRITTKHSTPITLPAQPPFQTDSTSTKTPTAKPTLGSGYTKTPPIVEPDFNQPTTKDYTEAEQAAQDSITDSTKLTAFLTTLKSKNYNDTRNDQILNQFAIKYVKEASNAKKPMLDLETEVSKAGLSLSEIAKLALKQAAEREALEPTEADIAEAKQAAVDGVTDANELIKYLENLKKKNYNLNRSQKLIDVFIGEYLRQTEDKAAEGKWLSILNKINQLTLPINQLTKVLLEPKAKADPEMDIDEKSKKRSNEEVGLPGHELREQTKIKEGETGGTKKTKTDD